MSGLAYALARAELIRALTAYTGIATSDGDADGTTIVDANLNGKNDFITEKTILIMSGDAQYEDRGALSFDNTPPATITVASAFKDSAGAAAQIKKGTIYRILNISTVEIDVETINTKIGTSADAAGTGSVFARLRQIVDTYLADDTIGLAAIKAAIASLAGGAFWGSYGPRNVEVDNDVDFGIMLYDPSGNVITTGEITPGTYTINRVRGAVDDEIVGSPDPASSEAAGRVYITYNFPSASWNVGDIFYVTFKGIKVTIDTVTTEYPDLYIWGRVVREADISSKVDAVEAKLDAQKGATGVFYEQADAAINEGVDDTEHFVVTLTATNTRYILRNLRLKSADPGVGQTITVKLYEFINDGEVNIDSFVIDHDNYGTHHSLMDMFGLPQIAGDSIRVSLTGSAAGEITVTGQYSHGKNNV